MNDMDNLREAIGREIDPRAFDRSRWYNDTEYGYHRAQLFGRIDSVLDSAAFKDLIHERHELRARVDALETIIRQGQSHHFAAGSL